MERQTTGVNALVAIDTAPGFVDALQRAWDAGDAVLPVDPRLPSPARAALLETMDPGGRPVQPGDALVVPTSGTTGAAKGVVLTHTAVAASARATTERLGVEPSRYRWLACLPLSHVGGLSVVTRALVTGTPVEVHWRFDAEAVMAAAGPEVFVSLVATALARVDPGRFHTVLLGGSAPPEHLPANVVTTYGMTETGSGVVYDGIPLRGVDVAIGPVGEIRVRGPMLLRAYRDGTVPLDAGGWFRTGDAGTFDAEGRLVVRGRMTDLIISGGEHVWPAAVEAVLRRHASVSEVSVGGRSDPEWGERVVAWVVPRTGAVHPTLDGLRGMVKEQLAPWAAPRELVIVDSLPKTATGKLRRPGDRPI